LYVKGAETIEPNLKRLTDYAKAHDITVVNTADWHTPESKELSDTPDFLTTFPKHCMRHTRGAMHVKATAAEKPYAIDWQHKDIDLARIGRRNIVIYKDHFDVFQGNPHTEAVLAYLKPDRAVVYGVATNVCVDYAVRGLRQRGVETCVVTDAIKELPNIPVDPVYNAWTKLGVTFTTTEKLIENLEARL
jgi:nicotinamidase/pyrazinamidase